MTNFKNILVLWSPLPEGMKAVKIALGLAKASQGKVTVLRVIPWHGSGAQGGPPELALRFRLVHEAWSELRRQLECFAKEGVLLKAKTVVGNETGSMIAEVLRCKHDLVIIFNEGHSRASVVKLMRECPAPVWMLKNHKHLKKILAAVDLNISDPTQVVLNQRILESAGALARFGKSELHVLHVCDVWGSVRALLPSSDHKKFVKQAKAGKRLELEAFLKAQDFTKYRMHIHEGNAQQMIPIVAARLGIDVIVMGNAARTGIASMLIGNTAEKILEQVRGSVFALKHGELSPAASEGRPLLEKMAA